MIARLLALGAPHGFTPSERQGFAGLARERPDGVTQRLDVISWSNRAEADRVGIPRAYLVLCLTVGGGTEDAGRWRLPLVEWPDDDQPRRRWPEVVAEFNEVFVPVFDLGGAEEARASMETRGPRYRLGADLAAASEEARQSHGWVPAPRGASRNNW